MNEAVFAVIIDGQLKQAAPGTSPLSWRTPFQMIGSKLTGGRFDLAEEAVREQIADAHKDDSFVRRFIMNRVKRQFVPQMQPASDANLAIGLGTVAGGGALAAGARQAWKARQYRRGAGALESLGGRLRGAPVAPAEAAANKRMGIALMGGLGGGAYLAGRSQDKTAALPKGLQGFLAQIRAGGRQIPRGYRGERVPTGSAVEDLGYGMGEGLSDFFDANPPRRPSEDVSLLGALLDRLRR